MVLDGVEDPHNLGAIVRTAHAAGAAAIVIPERRAAGLTEDRRPRRRRERSPILPVVRVTNVNRSLEDLKKRGYWIYGLDERGDAFLRQVESHGPTAFVLGGEGQGLHENVAKHCDFLVRIPMPGAAAGSLAERQRRGGRGVVRMEAAGSADGGAGFSLQRRLQPALRARRLKPPLQAEARSTSRHFTAMPSSPAARKRGSICTSRFSVARENMGACEILHR